MFQVRFCSGCCRLRINLIRLQWGQKLPLTNTQIPLVDPLQTTHTPVIKMVDHK